MKQMSDYTDEQLKVIHYDCSQVVAMNERNKQAIEQELYKRASIKTNGVLPKAKVKGESK